MAEIPPFIRREIRECERCRAAEGPFAYMADQRHYCVKCARRLLETTGLQPVGRREGDVTLEDLL